VAAYPAAAAVRQPDVVVGLGVAAVLVTAGGIVFAGSAAVAWGLLLFGGEYAVFLRFRSDAVDTHAPFVAAAVVIAAELAMAAIAPEGGPLDRPLILREAATLVTIGVAAALAAALLLVVAGSANAGIGFEALGALAAVSVLTALARAVRRPARPS
jgi:hypothetical protein